MKRRTGQGADCIVPLALPLRNEANIPGQYLADAMPPLQSGAAFPNTHIYMAKTL